MRITRHLVATFNHELRRAVRAACPPSTAAAQPSRAVEQESEESNQPVLSLLEQAAELGMSTSAWEDAHRTPEHKNKNAKNNRKRNTGKGKPASQVETLNRRDEDEDEENQDQDGPILQWLPLLEDSLELTELPPGSEDPAANAAAALSVLISSAEADAVGRQRRQEKGRNSGSRGREVKVKDKDTRSLDSDSGESNSEVHRSVHVQGAGGKAEDTDTDMGDDIPLFDEIGGAVANAAVLREPFQLDGTHASPAYMTPHLVRALVQCGL